VTRRKRSVRKSGKRREAEGKRLDRRHQSEHRARDRGSRCSVEDLQSLGIVRFVSVGRGQSPTWRVGSCAGESIESKVLSESSSRVHEFQKKCLHLMHILCLILHGLNCSHSNYSLRVDAVVVKMQHTHCLKPSIQQRVPFVGGVVAQGCSRRGPPKSGQRTPSKRLNAPERR